jgi:hypothetical protein
MGTREDAIYPIVKVEIILTVAPKKKLMTTIFSGSFSYLSFK